MLSGFGLGVISSRTVGRTTEILRPVTSLFVFGIEQLLAKSTTRCTGSEYGDWRGERDHWVFTLRRLSCVFGFKRRAADLGDVDRN